MPSRKGLSLNKLFQINYKKAPVDIDSAGVFLYTF